MEPTNPIRTEMMRSIVTEPLLSQISQADAAEKFDVIISLCETYAEGIDGAMAQVTKRVNQWGVNYSATSHYVFASLTAQQILSLAAETRDLMNTGRAAQFVYRIWEDTEIGTTLTRSLITVKADAAQRAFQARGDGIAWAVLDSGIQGDHRHFAQLDTLGVSAPLRHLDFTPDGRASAPGAPTSALLDRLGHGTHVAGIIAGCWQASAASDEGVIGRELLDEQTGQSIPQRDSLQSISGVAPQAKLVSLKVIADINRTGDLQQTAGQGKVSWVLLAIDQVQTWNQNGRRLLIHGVNMSLGYPFDPRWFACGQSPLCVEVNRLVRCGVAVVVSAGNGGYSFNAANGQGSYGDMTITDPGNADLAITVGSTHREMPHTYGVSYFSSRGPTGDGRLKPDLLAPGERIISCAAGKEASKYGTKDGEVLYCELSGTSMAAPHVSGAIAAFLSVRAEFIGQPERVKQILLDNAIDLRREPAFQGAGLLDLMKVLQAV